MLSRDMEGVHFAHPHTLFRNVEKILDKVGPDKFFSSSDENVKKAREGFQAYFFSLALKQYTGTDWWLSQPDQAVRAYPDFDFISFGNQIEDLKFEPVELVGVYPHFESFEQALGVITQKQKKYLNKSTKFSLLVFVNHSLSEDWVGRFRDSVTTEYPFLSIWTVLLKFRQGGKEVSEVVAEKIRPRPALRIVANTDDKFLHQLQPLPDYMEEIRENGQSYVMFKRDIVDKFLNKFRNP